MIRKKVITDDMVTIAIMMKALSHPSRVAIMYLLSRDKREPVTVKCIYKQLQQSQPVVSRHLGILKNAGLLLKYSAGKDTFYHVSKERVAAGIAEYFRQTDINHRKT